MLLFTSKRLIGTHTWLIRPYSTNNQLTRDRLFTEEGTIKCTLKCGHLLVGNVQPGKCSPFVFSFNVGCLCLKNKKQHNKQKQIFFYSWERIVCLKLVAFSMISAVLVTDIISVCKPWLVHVLKQTWVGTSSNSLTAFDDSFRGYWSSHCRKTQDWWSFVCIHLLWKLWDWVFPSVLILHRGVTVIS